MASNTENLDLLMKNPSTDGADTFNVQTMLNENWQKIDANAGTVAQTLANILKPTTPPIIGLPPSTTPDGMFQALGNTGELHVWRKSVAISTGTYSLGAVQEGLHYIKWANYVTSDSSVGTFEYGSEVSVNNDGTITGIKNPSTITIKPWYDDASKANVFKGKFIKMISQVETSMSSFKIGEIWWIPADATMTTGLVNGEGNTRYIAASKRQQVVGVPAGTTTTYPVSTNPKAYQEGDDAKAAGYVVGEVESGSFILGQANASEQSVLYTSSDPSVSDDGTINFDKSHFIQIGYATNWTVTTLQEAIRGKFLQREKIQALPSSYLPASTTYIPNDAVVTRSGDNYIVSKYQPVTGYAAIPAGTTIEYLGKLGDKARVQVVSYVGTGTYGKNNPCSLTFDFAPKVVRLLGGISSGGNFTVCNIYPMNTNYGIHSAILFTKALTTTYKARLGFSENNYTDSYCKISQDGKTVTWYNNGDDQINTAGYTYYFLALG